MINRLAERDEQLIWHPYTPYAPEILPVPILRGDGALLIDSNGNEIIDAIGSWWVNLHGHCNPHIAEAISRQLKELEQVIFAGFTHTPAVTLAEKLLPLLPGTMAKIFYSDNGSTAIEVALKMAMQFWHNQNITHKKKIIAFKGAYHGDTFGAMSLGERGLFTKAFETYLFDVSHIEVPVNGMEEASISDLKTHLEGDDVAAFIFEPLVQGAAGMVCYNGDTLAKLMKMCREKGVILIADEVMTGFGRLGTLFACDQLDEKPDITCLSKGLTGGFLPLGVTACSERIYTPFRTSDKAKTFFHGHSFTANPLACTSAVASLELLVREECKNDLERIEKSHQSFVAELNSCPMVSNPRGRGTILAFEISSGNPGYLHEFKDFFYHFFIDRNVLLRPIGNTIYILPPYCITDQQLQKVYSVIRESLVEFEKRMQKQLRASKSSG